MVETIEVAEMVEIEVGILGPLQLRIGGREVTIDRDPERHLLTRLLVAANHPVPLARLVDDVTPSAGPAAAPGSVPAALARLRRLLGPRRILTLPRGHLLVVRPGELDAARFVALTEQALRLALTPEHLVVLLDDADRLWRGPALDGFAGRPWARPLARQLERRRLAAVADRLDALLRGDRPRQVADEAKALLARFPREARLWSLLVIAHDRSGRHALALRTVRRARRVLGAGAIAPLLAMEQLEQALLERRPLPTPAPAAGQLTCGSTGPPRS